MSKLILYTSEDGKSRIQLRADEQTVWLTQLELAELFDASKQNVYLHLKNLFADGKLIEHSVVNDWLTTQFATRRVENCQSEADMASVKESLTVQFRGATKLIRQRNNERSAT